MSSTGAAPQDHLARDRLARDHLECNCLAVRQAARCVTQLYDRHLAAVGLRAGQFGILARLRRHGAMAIGDLAAELVIDRTTLGRNLRPLKRDGLITITPAREDRRIKELRLTPAGTDRLRMAGPAWAAAQAEFESGFGRKRAAELRSLLHMLVGIGAAAVDEP
ncbi:MAG TPA: MarR family transcriptional regulator [Stellaceae bacterium]|nr:MarR family transcriptional regulator [Stellaceae bacterium]